MKMIQQKLSSLGVRFRKLVRVAPLLMGAFISILCIVLLRHPSGVSSVNRTDSTGINTHLPAAHLKDSNSIDKMAYYEAARADSLKQKARERDSTPLPSCAASAVSQPASAPPGYH